MTHLKMFSGRRSNCGVISNFWRNSWFAPVLWFGVFAWRKTYPVIACNCKTKERKTTSRSWAMFDPDLWLRQQLWEQLWRGPAAVSAYWSIAIQLVCVLLSALSSTGLQEPKLWILLIIILLGVLLILGD